MMKKKKENKVSFMIEQHLDITKATIMLKQHYSFGSE